METTIKVCEESRDLIAILKQFNIAYDMFGEYMEKYYGKDRGASCEFGTDFYSKWCSVTSIVEDCLTKTMICNLRETHFSTI